jgi:hypothetical protein
VYQRNIFHRRFLSALPRLPGEVGIDAQTAAVAPAKPSRWNGVRKEDMNESANELNPSSIKPEVERQLNHRNSAP